MENTFFKTSFFKCKILSDKNYFNIINIISRECGSFAF